MAYNNTTDSFDDVKLKQNTTESVLDDIRLIHNILGTSFSILGFFTNFVTLIAIMRYRLYRNKFILFIINLIIINCLSSGFSLAYITYQSFTVFSSAEQNTKVCRITGYITYALLGTEVIAIIQISFNRYFRIVHLDKYMTIYSSRKKIITMVITSWLVYFILMIFPCTELWGKLLYDSKRFICQPFLAKDSFTKFFLVFSISISAPPLSFCYFSIIHKIISTRRHVMTKRDTTRQNDKQHGHKPLTKMPLTIIAILTAFVVLYIPIFIVEAIDPSGQRFDPKVQVVAAYLVWLHLICHPIIYAALNKEIQKALKKMFRCVGRCEQGLTNTNNIISNTGV